MAGNDLHLGIQFEEKGLDEILNSLRQLQGLTKTDLFKIQGSSTDVKNFSQELTKIRSSAQTVEEALEKAFNPKLNSINLQTFNQALANSGTNLAEIQRDFSKAGVTGENAFRSLTAELLTSKKEVKQTSTLIDSMAKTLTNTIKWNIASSAINTFSRSIQQAYGYVKALDGSLNDIRIVTQKSADQMAVFADQANKSAKQLGATTTDYTDAALTFYQQGLDDKEVKARTELTTKVANTSGLSKEDAAEYVTAVLNGYKVGSEEAEAAMDILANVGAHTASSLSELSEAMSKVSSTASTMGVSEEQLASSLATVIQTTRQDASQVGTAFKTIFMRISDIQAGTEDAEVSLGQYTGKMAELGYNVLDSTGQLRDLGEVMEEIGGNWANMSREQQIALARTMAGTRQANNLLALFDNWSTYGDAMQYATDAQGTLQQQQDIYMESTAAHLAKVKASWEDVYDSLLKAENINNVADVVANVGTAVADVIDGIGGLDTIILGLGGTAMKVFSKNIAQGISRISSNVKLAQSEIEKVNLIDNLIKANPELEGQVRLIEKLQTDYSKYSDIVDASGQEALNSLLKQRVELENQEKQIKATQEKAKTSSQKIQGEKFKDSNYEREVEEIKALQKQTDTLYQKKSGLDKDSKEAEQISANLENIAQKMEVYTTKANNLNQANQILGQENKKLSSSLNNFNVALQTTSKDSEETTAALKDMQVEYNRLATAYSKATGDDSFKDVALNAENAEEKIKELQKAVEAAREDLSAYEQGLNSELNNASEKAEKAIEDFEKQERKITKGLDTTLLIQNITNVIGAVGQLSAGFEALYNIPKIWDNENLTDAEKLFQTISALTMGVTMIGPALSTLNTAIPAIVGITGGFSGAAAGATTLTGALGQLVTAAGGVIPFLTGLIPVIGAIAVVAGVVGVAIWSLNKRLKELHSETLEEAENRVEGLNDSYQNLKTSIEESAAAYENYKDAQDTLKDLDKGTQEYADTVAAASDNVLALAEALDLVQGEDFTYNTQTGGYELTDKGKEKAEAAQETAADKTRRASQVVNVANMGTERARINDADAAIDKAFKYKEDENGDSITKSDDFASLKDKITEGFKSGDLVEENFDEKFASFVDELAESSKAIKDNKEALLENSSLFKDLGVATKHAADANQYYAQGIMSAELSGNKEYVENPEYQALKEAGMSTETISKAVLSNNSIKEQLEGVDVSQVNTFDQMNKVLEGAGLETLSSMQDAVDRYADLIGEKLDFDGEKVTKEDGTEVEADDIYKAISSDGLVQQILSKDSNQQEIKEALTNVNTKLQETSSVIKDNEKLGSSLGFEDEDFKEQIQNAFINATSEEQAKQNLANMFSYDQLQNLEKGDNESALQNLLNDPSFGELANSLGYQIGDSFGKTATDYINNNKADLEQASISDDISSATTVSELTEQKGRISSDDVELTNQYNSKLIEIASNYKNAADEIERLRLAQGQLAEAKEEGEGVKEAQDAVDKAKEEVEGATRIGELSEESGFSTEEIENYAGQLKAIGKFSEKSKIELAELAKTQLRYQRAVDNSINSIGDWKEALKNFKTKGTMMDSDTVQDIKDAYSDLIDVDVSAIGDDFYQNTENMKLMEEAINGDQEAIEQLAENAGKEIYTEVGIDGEGFEADKERIMGSLGNLQDEFDSGATLNADLEAEGFFNELNNLINSTSMSVSQAQALLSGMGIDAEIEEVEVKSKDSEEVVNSVPVLETETHTNLFPWAEGGGVNEDGEYSKPTTGAEPVGASYSGVRYENDKDTEEKNKTTTATALKVKSAKKKQFASGGNVSHNKKKSPGGGGGGGKKSGGKKSPKKNKTQKGSSSAVTFKKDPYRNVNKRINRAGNEMSKLQKKRDKFYGKDILKNLKQQTEQIETQLKLEKQKLNIAEKQLKNQTKQLTKKTSDILNDDVKYKNSKGKEKKMSLQDLLGSTKIKITDGIITNYDKVLKKLATKINDRKSNKTLQDKLLKKYEKLKDKMDEYTETREEIIAEQEEKILDLLYESINNKAEIFMFRFNATVDLSDVRDEVADFQKELAQGLARTDFSAIGDSLKDSLDEYIGADFAKNGLDKDSYLGVAIAQAEALNKELRTLSDNNKNTFSTIYSVDSSGLDTKNTSIAKISVSDKNQLMEDLKLTLDQIRDYGSKAKSLIIELYENTVSAADNLESHMSQYIESLETINSYLSQQIDLQQLLHGDNASYKDLANFYALQAAYAESQVQASQDAYTLWGRKLLELQEQYKEGLLTGDEYEYLFNTYAEKWTTALDSLNTSIENELNILNSQYENTIRDSLQSLTSRYANIGDIDLLQSQLTALTEKSELYLDDVNRAYSLQTLQNKWVDSINNASSTARQKQLTAVMEEQMKMLEEKDKLTQTDLDRAEKLYDVEVKRAALEDARNNKSKMRLVRDASGSYNYQFVADTDEVAKATQELATAKNDLYNFDKDAYKNNLNEMASIWNEYQEALVEAYTTYGNDTEELAIAKANIENQYQAKITQVATSNITLRKNLEETAQNHLIEIYGETSQFYKDGVFSLESYIDVAGSAIQTLTDRIQKDLEVGKTATTEATENASALASTYVSILEELDKKQQDFQTSLQSISDMIPKLDTQIQLFDEENIATTSTTVQQLLESLASTYEDFIDPAAEQFENVSDSLENIAGFIKLIEPYFKDSKTLTSEESSLTELANNVGASSLSDLDRVVSDNESTVNNLSKYGDKYTGKSAEELQTMVSSMDANSEEAIDVQNAINALNQNEKIQSTLEEYGLSSGSQAESYYNIMNSDGTYSSAFDRYLAQAQATTGSLPSVEDALKKLTLTDLRTNSEAYQAFQSKYINQPEWVSFVNSPTDAYQLGGGGYWIVHRNGRGFDILKKNGNIVEVDSDFSREITTPTVKKFWESDQLKAAGLVGDNSKLFKKTTKGKIAYQEGKTSDYISFLTGDAYDYNKMRLASLVLQGKTGDYTRDYLKSTLNTPFAKFKTGGLADFTGPAWLDGSKTKPELVLNPVDTKNMITTVGFMRDIAKTLSGNTTATIANHLGNLATNNIIEGSAGTVDQNVYITATFEGQTEAYQIQTALNNLINTASQRANRDKKKS